MGLLNSLAQGLSRHSRTSSFQPPPLGKRQDTFIVGYFFLGLGPLRYYLLVGPLAFAFQIRHLVSQRDSYYTTLVLLVGPQGHYFLAGPLASAFQIRSFAP